MSHPSRSWVAEDDGRVALQPEGASACSVLALYLDTKDDVVLVGALCDMSNPVVRCTWNMHDR